MTRCRARHRRHSPYLHQTPNTEHQTHIVTIHPSNLVALTLRAYFGPSAHSAGFTGMPGMKDTKTKYLNSLSHGTRAVFPYTLQKICTFAAVPTDSCEQGKAGHTNACIKRAHAGPIAHHAPRLGLLTPLFSFTAHAGTWRGRGFFFPFFLFFLHV